MGRVEAVQPQCQRLASERLARRAFNLGPAGLVEPQKFGLQLQFVVLRSFVTVVTQQVVGEGMVTLDRLDEAAVQPCQHLFQPLVIALASVAAQRLKQGVGGELDAVAQRFQPRPVDELLLHLEIGGIELPAGKADFQPRRRGDAFPLQGAPRLALNGRKQRPSQETVRGAPDPFRPFGKPLQDRWRRFRAGFESGWRGRCRARSAIRWMRAVRSSADFMRDPSLGSFGRGANRSATGGVFRALLALGQDHNG